MPVSRILRPDCNFFLRISFILSLYGLCRKPFDRVRVPPVHSPTTGLTCHITVAQKTQAPGEQALRPREVPSHRRALRPEWPPTVLTSGMALSVQAPIMASDYKIVA